MNYLSIIQTSEEWGMVMIGGNDIQTRRDFWIPKIERNIERDKEVTAALESDGWIVIRFWGKEIKTNTRACADIIVNALKGRE